MMYQRTKLTHVAIRFRGEIYSLPAPSRHHDVLRKIIEKTGVASVDVRLEDEGFLDEMGQYLNRKQALMSAEICKQLKPGTVVHAGELTSENVW